MGGPGSGRKKGSKNVGPRGSSKGSRARVAAAEKAGKAKLAKMNKGKSIKPKLVLTGD